MSKRHIVMEETVARAVVAEVERLKSLILEIRAQAQMIVDTQSEMHPRHRELVQMIVDATKRVDE